MSVSWPLKYLLHKAKWIVSAKQITPHYTLKMLSATYPQGFHSDFWKKSEYNGLVSCPCSIVSGRAEDKNPYSVTHIPVCSVNFSIPERLTLYMKPFFPLKILVSNIKSPWTCTFYSFIKNIWSVDRLATGQQRQTCYTLSLSLN